MRASKKKFFDNYENFSSENDYPREESFVSSRLNMDKSSLEKMGSILSCQENGR
jgi:hypothetical protein